MSAAAYLDQGLRAKIRTALLARKFNEEAEQLRVARAGLAFDLYQRLYDAPTRERMAALPEGWLPEQSELAVELGGTVRCVKFNGSPSAGGYYAMRQFTQVPSTFRQIQAHHSHGVVLTLDGADPLTAACDRLEAAWVDLRERRDRLGAEVDATLAQFRTIATLVKDWPEVVPFLPERQQRTATAVAVPRARLNELLDLPVEAPAP